MTRRIVVCTFAFAASSLVVACAGDEGPPAELSIDGAWARPTPSGATNGVVYLTITPDIDDTIIGARVADPVAAAATLHMTSVGGTDEGSHHGTGGSDDVVSMVATDVIELAAGVPFEFAPGGNHIMLTDLAQPLTVDRHFTLILQLASGRTPTVDVTVSNNPPDT